VVLETIHRGTFGFVRPQHVDTDDLEGRLSWSASQRREGVRLSELLADLEAKSKAAGSGFRWVALNRAGDLCDHAGDRDGALKYYGRAIDVMLEDGQPEPARGLATKIVRIHPTAVRTLCTLTWLDLASHHMASVVVHLTEYVKSAQGAGVQDLAGEQIYMMAQVATDQDFRCAAVDVLQALGHKDEAAEVRDWAAAEGAPHDGESPEDWADRCLSHALGSNVRRVAGQANGEETSEESPEQVDDVLAKGDPTAEDLPEEYRT
jgi:hypothetical protein